MMQSISTNNNNFNNNNKKISTVCLFEVVDELDQREYLAPKLTKEGLAMSDDILTSENPLSLLNKYERNNLFQKEINKVIKQKGYKGFGEKILKETIYRTGSDLTSIVGQKKISDVVGCSTKTVERWYKKYVEDGTVSYEFRGTRNSKLTNKTTMLCLKHLLSPVTDKMSDNINTLTSLRDLESYNTYESYVSIFNNSEIKMKKPIFDGAKNIDSQKLKGTEKEKDDEITRFCLAYFLSQQDIQYVKGVMKSKSNITKPAGFLFRMVDGIVKGVWNKFKTPKPLPTGEEAKAEQEEFRLQALMQIQRTQAMLSSWGSN